MSRVLVKGDEADVARAAEAIIEEARHRQRRRWFWRAVAALGVVLALGLALLLSGVGGASATSLSGHSTAPRSAGVAALGARTVEGRFVAIGGPPTLPPEKLSGTIRFVARHGGKTYLTHAKDGRWRIKVPAGRYTVQGHSTQVNHGVHWSLPTKVRVGTHGAVRGVEVFYSTLV